MRRGRLRTGLEASALIGACALLATWIAHATDGGLGVDIGGQRWTLQSPRALALLGVLPLLVWIDRHGLSELSAWRRALALGLRAAALAALAVALARPSVPTRTERLAVVFVVDVSDSMTDAALEPAARLLEATWRRRGEADVQLVTFARTARLVPSTDGAQPPRIARHPEPDAGAATDVSAAIRLALALVPADRVGRVVLVSDGLETEGDMLAEARAAHVRGVPIDHVVPRAALPVEAAVTGVRLPDEMRVGEPFRVRIGVRSTARLRARLQLWQDGHPNGMEPEREVDIAPGDGELEMPSVVRVPGPVTYRARLLLPTADRFATNDEATASGVATGRPLVLVIDSEPARTGPLASMLSAANLDVDVRAPAAMPSTAELARVELVVLSDVPADAVRPADVETLERWVRSHGGALLVAGGPRAFGPGGWQGSRLEAMLPVRLEGQQRRDQPSLALALVIDKSGSMSGQKIELAKEAARAAAEALGPDDYITVIGFDTAPVHVVRMQAARNRFQILRDIGRLTARGGTNIFPALDAAYQDLAVVRARSRHVILLTDGISPEAGLAELVQAMRAEGITVSTVGLGADVNRALLAGLAASGGGRSYFTNDPSHVPRIFVRETHTVARSDVVEEYVRAVPVATAAFLRGVDLATAPALRGYVATRARGAPAQTVLETDLGEPLLARWRLGSGWVLAWTSDLKPRWSADWMRWSGFSKLLAQLVREHARRSTEERLAMSAHVEDGVAVLRVDAIGGDDRFLDGLVSTATVEGPMAAAPHARERLEVPLLQTAPGRYEGRVPLHRYGSFLVSAEHRRDAEPVARSSTQLVHPYPREYARLEPDVERLAAVSRATGGRSDPDVEQILDTGGRGIEVPRARQAPALALVLVLFLLDTLVRRLPVRSPRRA
ncbi:MAG: VWA domain-containing protein [Myxococcales bacterium]|nr:VWA domain-containing protein [Myxococcales bacterium]